MKRFLFTLVIVFLISACGASSTEEPTAVPTLVTVEPVTGGLEPSCISPNPTDADIDRALSYTEGLFNGAEWNRSYTVAETRVSVTWDNSTDAAIAYLEALIFPCTYEEPDLNNYFSAENWSIVFGNYESYQPVAECKTDDGLRLYQFSAVEQGYEYNIKYWVENDTDTRVIATMIVFPVDSGDLMDEYSNSLFPQLTSCN